MEKFDVTIIGAGPAGLEAAHRVAEAGLAVLLLEQEPTVGGKLKQWDKLFPDFTAANEVLEKLKQPLNNPLITLKTDTASKEIVKQLDNTWKVTDQNGAIYESRALLLTTGFDFFDARRKEEYGYGIYPNVLTSVELEEYLAKKELPFLGGVAERKPQVAFIQCVGSRDEKVGNHFCSRNCCVCAVKQSIEVKEFYPEAQVYCFYMDLRMFGQSYEELYRKAQQDFGISFVRGRVS